MGAYNLVHKAMLSALLFASFLRDIIRLQQLQSLIILMNATL